MARDAGASVARIATHCTEADVSLQHFAAARDMDMETVGFLMLAHRVGPEELAKQARIMVDGGAQCVYVVDSAGALVLGDAQERVAALIKPAMWQRMRTGSAAKDYHWAMIEITPDDTPCGHDDGHAFLLLRKHRYTGTVSYFPCWTPAPSPSPRLSRSPSRDGESRKITSWENRPPGSTVARSPPGPPGTAGPRLPCSPTPSSPSQPPASAPATQTPANSGSSPSPSLSCCGNSAAP
jgi:hypothetical protein